ncbi:MAG TPA: hypothetical protein VFP84_35635 [Kofleriaceae bacterium]|nr:hypothetical protein [Kofleriaceae bacterium]
MVQPRVFQVSMLAMSLGVTACVADLASSTPPDEAPAPALAVDAAPHVEYFGGPVLAHIAVHPVWWRSTTRFQAGFNTFYPSVVNSAWWAVLAQYGVFPGTATAGVTDNNLAVTVSDAAIHTELNRLFANGSLPSPSANSYYPVHFPQGMHITAPDGSQSCVQFCSYLGTYVRNGVNVVYGVLPDVGDAGCNTSCGTSTSVQNNEQLQSSHLLIEAATNPAAGLATVFGPPLGWFDPNNGSIADLCSGQQGLANGLVVQKIWSNAANACVDH